MRSRIRSGRGARVARLGIRREDKNRWERRTPLAPSHVARLVEKGVEVLVQPSPIRAFEDGEYERAGARIEEDLSGCNLVLGVKEMPLSFFRPGGNYMYFAHVIKGQPYNMPMLARLLELGCTLIDYEKITDDSGRRLVFFGRHAGLAGMADTLYALGQRLAYEGIKTPLADLRQAHAYGGLESLKRAVEEAGRKLAGEGIPQPLRPMVVGFAGYGNVSRGAQEIFDLLPHRAITPEQLLKGPEPSAEFVYKVVFEERHMAEPAEPGRNFDLREYYEHPERYRGAFARYLDKLTVLVNCIYWTERYPRLLGREDAKRLWGGTEHPKLKVIGDISCDVEGAIELTVRTTTPDEPVFVYLVDRDEPSMGFEGKGPVVLAVDNLPCELPVESSNDFGEALWPLVADAASADFAVPFGQLELPPELTRAVIVHRGRLTPGYEYLREHLERHGGQG
ncbi:MAG: hypothetical protein D6806_07580 [Deltaproteobacteria bacterium]|nr:MAG: hypothetical protein D6806_07580 [Deltaproteobacteria bacterium]